MSDQERDGNLGEVIDRRVQVYGNPVETFARIAQVWSGILGHEVQPWEVPLMMAGMKMVRAQVMPDYSDNSDDIDGYLDIFRKIIGPDMIHARTVNEFIEKKWPAKAERVLVDKDECRHWNRHLQMSDHTEAECPVAGIAADNARQSKFYAENDRTKDAGPDEDEDEKLCTCPAPMEGGSHYDDCAVRLRIPKPDPSTGHVFGCTLSDGHAGTCCICSPGSSTCKIGCPSRRD